MTSTVKSHSLRSKEDAMDYRYFPEPDLPPLVIDPKYIEERAATELPIDRRKKYEEEYKLSRDDARILSEDRILSDFYEKIVNLSKDPKKSCSIITTILFPLWPEAMWIQGQCNLHPVTKLAPHPFLDAAERVAQVVL